MQAERNFYRPLFKSTYLHDGVIAVRKRGKGKDTKYEFARAGDRIDLPPDDFDFDSFLEHLADPAEMQAVIDSLTRRLVLQPCQHLGQRSPLAESPQTRPVTYPGDHPQTLQAPR